MQVNVFHVFHVHIILVKIVSIHIEKNLWFQFLIYLNAYSFMEDKIITCISPGISATNIRADCCTVVLANTSTTLSISSVTWLYNILNNLFSFTEINWSLSSNKVVMKCSLSSRMELINVPWGTKKLYATMRVKIEDVKSRKRQQEKIHPKKRRQRILYAFLSFI